MSVQAIPSYYYGVNSTASIPQKAGVVNLQHASNSCGRGHIDVNAPNFMGLEKDTVEISADEKIKKNSKSEKSGMSTGAKWGIGLGLTALGCIGARFGLQKLAQRGFKNIQVTNFTEKVIFKKAETKEEALKFIKETLKISNVDEKFTLEELNYINRSLTDVINAQKGKCALPKSITAMDKEMEKIAGDDAAAATIVNVFSKQFGNLEINRSFFEAKRLDSLLKDCYFHKDGTQILKPEQLYKLGKDIYYKPVGEYSKLLEKYYSQPTNLCLEEKLKLLESYTTFQNNITNLKNGITIGEKGCKITSQHKTLQLLLQQDRIVHHEMGHLQELYMKENNITSNPFKYLINIYRNKLNVLPTKTHSEFIKDKKIQEIAGKVSEYAKTDEREFIAEVYSGLITGRNFSDDVISLYKKYGGPVL